MSTRTSQLIRNIGIYAVGSISSKIVMFLLVPLYSFYIAPDDFGYYDLCFSVVMAMLPVLTVQMRDGVFRFLIDSPSAEKSSQVVTYAVRTLITTTLLCLLVAGLLQWLHPMRYLWLTALFAITFSPYEVYVQMLRGLGHNKLFAGAGILSSLLICTISIVMVVWLRMGVPGVFWGNILGRALTMAIIECRLRLLATHLRTGINLAAVGKEMKAFCLPLVALNILIWILGSSDRFFIQHYIGLEQNGIYAVAFKFATILQFIAIVILQAWQETAIHQYKSTDKTVFFSQILEVYTWILIGLVIIMSFGLKALYPVIVGNSYQSGIIYIFPLLISIMLMHINCFYDIIYFCEKATFHELRGYVIAVTALLTGYLILSPLFLIWGILLTQICAYAVLLAHRMYDTRRYIKIHITKRIAYYMATLICAGAAFLCCHNNSMQYIIAIASIICLALTAPAKIKSDIVKRFVR